MRYVVVLPFVFSPWKDECLANCRIPRSNILLVDNTMNNRGVSASWNLGIDKLKKRQADWLIILSAAIRFGKAGGLDFIEALETDEDSLAVEAAMGMGWHLIAFRRKTLEKVGRFDENFYPVYYEDIDYAWRINLAYGGIAPPYWKKVTVDVMLAGWGHGVTLGKVDPRGDETKGYMLKKWGALTGVDMYKHPFNEIERPLQYWPETSRGGKWDA